MAQVRNTYSNTGLNALRGIGITGIVLYHLFPSVFCGGFMGVPLFFVLSGYFMYTTSEKRSKRGTFHAFDYYKRRIHKILPPLFSMVMCVCCYLTITHSRLLFGMKYEVLKMAGDFTSISGQPKVKNEGDLHGNPETHSK